MNGFARLALSVLVTTTSLGCASTHTSHSDPVAGANDLDRRYIEAFNRGDAEGVAACYAKGPDVILQPPHPGLVKGWDAIREHYRQMFAAMPKLHLELSDHTNRPAGDVVIGTGAWSLAFDAPGGAKSTMNGILFEVKGVRDGKWVYLADCAVVPMQEPQ
jgi:uncharacterized protein (TIGR02246 family)